MMVPPRIGTPHDPSRPTLGGVWAELMFGLGFEPHPWQQLRADVQYELVPAADGWRLAAGTSGTMVGRQGGKTASSGGDVLLRALAPSLRDVADLVGHPIGPQTIVFTAQDRQAAVMQWQKHVELILASEYVVHVKGGKPVRTHGSECLNFVNGSSYRVITPSTDAARGMSVDLAIIDEALTHQVDLLDVIEPTMAQRDSARNSFGAQLMIISNAGDERAELLNQQRELGRRAVADGDRSRVWLEWSCADDDDPLDPAVWARTVPTLDQPDGIGSAFLARAAETLGTDAFAREYLCRTVWSQARRVIDVDVWAELPHVTAEAWPVVGVEIDNDRAGAVVAAAGQSGDHIAVKVLDMRAGVDWVIPYIATLDAPVVVVDRNGPASTLVPGLEQVATVHRATTPQVADAAAGFVDAVLARRVGHTGDNRFQDAVTFLARRLHGDRWAFDRSRGSVGPIIAASLAVWMLETQHAVFEQPAVL